MNLLFIHENRVSHIMHIENIELRELYKVQKPSQHRLLGQGTDHKGRHHCSVPGFDITTPLSWHTHRDRVVTMKADNDIICLDSYIEISVSTARLQPTLPWYDPTLSTVFVYGTSKLGLQTVSSSKN